jgi:hypothetical protein
MKIGYLVFIVYLFVSCESTSSTSSDSDNCKLLNTLVWDSFVNSQGNFHMNDIIPILENQSGILSNASKGSLGYIYENDSLLIVDLKKWKDYFGCTHGYPNSTFNDIDRLIEMTDSLDLN